MRPFSVPEFAVGSDVSIEGHALDSEFVAKGGNRGVALDHGGLSQTDLGFVRANFRPSLRPRALAAARPAMVRSRMRSRSNSARVAKMPKIMRPEEVVVSICAPFPVSTLRPT